MAVCSQKVSSFLKRTAVVAVGVAAVFAGGEVRAATFYVTSEGGGDGSSWASPATLGTALASAGVDDVLYLKAGIYAVEASAQANGYAIAAGMTLYGGLAGTDDTTLADDPLTLVDGAGTYPTGNKGLLNLTAASGTVVLSRIGVARSRYRGLDKSGAANVTLSRCRIAMNGNASGFYTGRGGNFVGSASASELRVDHCLIVSNGWNVAGNNGNASGYGLYVSGFKKVTLLDTDFLANGSKPEENNVLGRDATHGAALYLANAPVAATNCEFRANTVVLHDYNNRGDGGIVWVSGACGGSTFASCRFVGNCARRWNTGYGGAGGGTIVVSGNTDHTVLFDRCTVAFNYASTGTSTTGPSCAAGLTVRGGLVTVRDSIFHANACIKNDMSCRDVLVSGGTCTLEDTFVADTTETCLRCVNSAGLGGTLVTRGLITDDPRLATDEATFFSLLNGSPSGYDAITHLTWFKSRAEMYLPDVHLKSTGGRYADGAWVTDAVDSPAVDAASRTAPYANEPTPNGSRANAGGYSDTAEASKPMTGAEPSFGTAVTVDQTPDYSNPHFGFTLADGPDSLIDVTLYVATNEADAAAGRWLLVRTAEPNYHPGDAVDIDAGTYFPTGVTLYWKIVLSGHVTGAAETSGSFAVTSPMPPFWTAGGDATKVVHVWTGAPGDNNGTSWRHAYRTLAAGLTALADDPEKTELWLYGETFAVAATISLTRPVAIYGGFDASESDPASRASALETVLDGAKAVQLFTIATSTGTTVLDGVTLWRGLPRAIEKTGNGDLRLAGVTVQENGEGDRITGRGLSMSGGGVAHLTVTNCLFKWNLISVSLDNYTKSEAGTALYLSSLAGATVTDSEFVQNGFVNNVARLSGRDRTFGSVVYAGGAPTVFERCRFAGNGTMVHGCGGCLYFGGASGGSALRNCSFAGNYGVTWSVMSAYGQVVCVELANKTDAFTVENCTFAYNLGPQWSTTTQGDIPSATALTVVKGTAEVRNSIFWGNRVDTIHNGAADIWAAANGIVNVSYSLFEATGVNNIRTGSGGAVNLGEGIVTDVDPLFATSLETFTNLLDSTGLAFAVAKVGRSGPDDLDVHLRSVQGRYDDGAWVLDEASSPAIDRGDPSAAYANETSPNGSRLNLGTYGNTAEASRTDAGVPEVTDLVIRQDAVSHKAFVEFTTGGTGRYQATLKVCTGTTDGGDNDAAWDVVQVLPGTVGKGESCSVSFGMYFEKGATAYYRVSLVAPGGSDVESGSVTITIDPPVLVGGGDSVIHVKPGALGFSNGRNWTDAVPTIADALALVDVAAGRTNIWISGDQVLSAGFETDLALSFVGGFDGTESAASARRADAKSGFDGGNAARILVTLSAADGTVSFDGIAFSNVAGCAIQKTGAGSLTLRSCQIGPIASALDLTHALKMTGSAASSVLTLEDTFVYEVRDVSFEAHPWYSACGMIMYLDSLREVVWKNVEIRQCGWKKGKYERTSGRENDPQAFYLNNAPIHATGLRFLGNSTGGHNADKGGTLIGLHGNGAGSTFTNCLFAGNCVVPWGVTLQGNKHCLIDVDMDAKARTVDFESCTIAYNVSSCGYTAGLLCRTGMIGVHNSIFFGNVVSDTWGVNADLCVRGANADVDVSYTQFTDDTTYGSSAGTLDLSNTYLGDPLFATSAEHFRTNYLVSGGMKAIPKSSAPCYVDSYADFTALDVHLKSYAGWTDERTGELVRTPKEDGLKVYSPAIDRGDRRSAYAREPAPNGSRINLGAYGNTPYASMSRLTGLTLIVR